MIKIDGKQIGPDQPCYIICEAGVAHNGDIRTALRLIDVAKDAGADAVKFQHWNTARLLLPDHPMYPTLLPLELSEGQLRCLKAHADEVGITFLCTPDQVDDADFLDELGVPAFKVGSGNLRNLLFLRHVAAKGKPVLLSTGMATMDDVQAAVDAITLDGGNNQIVLLHCASAYPAPPEACNLRAMQTLGKFGYPVGYSVHTRLPSIIHAAVALGASVLEMHFMLRDGWQGPDAAVSLDEHWLMDIIGGIRHIEAALGDGVKRPMEAERATMEYVDSWRR